MARKSAKSVIKCRATRRHLLNGSEMGDLQGIRVTVAYPQKRTLRDMAESINHSNSATVADVLAVWNAMEEEIIRSLSDGNRVELGTLGTLSLEVGTKQRKGVDEVISNKDIVAKSITFAPSKRLANVMGELAFECDGIVSQPLNDDSAEEALVEYFSKYQFITARNFATLCKCSRNTAYRRVAKMVADGKLKQSDFSGMYEMGNLKTE